ncbi:uncharacterized protein METZ01_LOCUS448605, partial [marine metagenome]
VGPSHRAILGSPAHPHWGYYQGPSLWLSVTCTALPS